MDDLLGPMKKYNAMRRKNGKKQYKPKMVFTLGNHECVEENTEVLTEEGWVLAKEITKNGSKVASFSLDSGEITFSNPLEVEKVEDSPLLKVSSNLTEELVSTTHHCIVDNKRTPIKDGMVFKQKQLFNKFHKTPARS